MALKIGELARVAGVNVQTVRYYERRGILAPPPRTASGYRAYETGTLDRLRFIRHAQNLGFTLEEIEGLLSLRAELPDACPAVEVRARARLADVDRKIAELTRLRGVLVHLVEACARSEPTCGCPILALLDEASEEE